MTTKRFSNRTRVIRGAVCAMVLFLVCQPDVARANEDRFFEKKVRPLLVQRCVKCHSGTRTSGGLALDSRSGWQRGGESGPAIIPGDPAASLLIQAINYESLQMPPESAGGKLGRDEIAVLKKWVQQGAFDPRDAVTKLGGMSEAAAQSWWAFQPLHLRGSDATPESPQAVVGEPPTRHGRIDEFLNTELAKQLLAPAAPVDRRTLIRRATYDLTGLPPTPEEVEHFIADQSDDAFAGVVDRLLESPQYGVRWGRHWLDVVRYADTAGENTDRPLPHAWRYRNWVIDAMNRDLPYDQFVRLQLAGDILQAENPTTVRNGVVATGYLAIARRFGHDIDKDIHLMHEDVIDNVGRTFLGLSIACARCHDHKYDPITADDYYALYGIFNSTRFSFPGCEPKGQPRDLVPLLPQVEIDEIVNAWQQRNAKAVAEKKRREEAALALRARVKDAASTSSRLLAEAKVAEGASVAFAAAQQTSLDRIFLRKGEILQLTVLPNGSHGADTTLVEWKIVETRPPHRTWDVADVVPDLMKGNPLAAADGASWSFLDVADGPQFLTDRRTVVDGVSDLNAWSSGDTPSVLVNRSAAPVDVWTTLTPKSFFVHPGINRNVAVAWVCPEDMEVRISGRVADAHPSGGDGVALRLDHIAVPEAGPALVELGAAVNAPELTIEPEPVLPVAYAVVEGSPADAAVHIRGNPEEPGNVVPRRWLSIFGGANVAENAGSGRRQLADWITGHPLSARVMVNRIWHWHFGRGLVATPNDFGSRGATPSHPELLEYLATAFRNSGFRVKAMHRLMMNTAAYQRGSDWSEAVATRDPNNSLLSRFARRRLSAEEIRDSLLLMSGQLDMTPGEAHPFPPEASWTFTQHDPFTASYDTRKRSVFLMVQRQRRDPYLALFDGADPNASTAVRQTTTVPTQALYFMNAPFFHDQADGVARRLLSLPDNAARIRRAFQLLFQRLPTEAEVSEANLFLDSYPENTEAKWAAYARILLASNEFLFID
ncbi:MAG: PSD1 and planctomycete cytochrome C domain-containing protein [Fuerstiella sp.]